MEKNLIIFLTLISTVGLMPFIYAEVSIPKNELIGYYDSQGIYTIVGAVRNTENYPIQSSLHLKVLDDDKIISVDQILPVVFPNKDIPFKIKVNGVTGKTAAISKYDISFKQVLDATESKVGVVYDRTLKKHSDGHLTGKIINHGNSTQYNVKVYATLHGENNTFVDTAKNIEKIDKIEPGQIVEFTMYPDPNTAQDVNYYSCFGIGDETITPLAATRFGEKFNFRFDSSASFIVEGFDKTGTKLSLYGINSFKFPTYVNFEFPMTSKYEKFSVTMNEKIIPFVQSLDEQGNWHVAFDVPGSTQVAILISGFESSDSKISEKIENDQEMEKSKISEKTTVFGFEGFLYLIVILILIMIGIAIFKISQKKRK